jgi:hypothetical protein
MYNRIGFDNYISRFTGEEMWTWSTSRLLKKEGIESLMDIELYERFCEENNINLSNKDKTNIVFKESFEPLDFFKYICKLGLVKYNWSYYGIKQPFYWTNILKERGKYSTEELYKMFIEKYQK